MTEDQAKAAIPNITNQFVQVIEVISSPHHHLNGGKLLANVHSSSDYSLEHFFNLCFTFINFENITEAVPRRSTEILDS